MDFQTLHRYNRLAVRNIVPPLTCPLCGATVALGRDRADDTPLYNCFDCGATTRPGLGSFLRIKKLVEEKEGLLLDEETAHGNHS